MSLQRGLATLRIEERLHNESAEDFAIMWGHHPAFGEPFLDDSCQVQTPAESIRVLAFHEHGLWEPGEGFKFPQAKNRRTGQLQDVTRVLSRETKSVDVLSFWGLKSGWYGLTNQRLRVGFGMAWDLTVFPCLWMWQVYGGHHDYPWYGRTYNCALEPFAGWPPAGVANAIKNGTARTMKAGETIETDLAAVVYEGEGVSGIGRDGIVST